MNLKKRIAAFVLTALATSIVQTDVTNAAAARKLPESNVKPCVEREILAKNIKTGKTETFQSTCKVPEGYVELGRSGYTNNLETKKDESVSNVVEISVPKSANAKRITVLISKYATFELSNTTLPATAVKVIRKGSYSFVVIRGNAEGKVFVNVTKKEEKDLFIFAWKNGGKVQQKKFSLLGTSGKTTVQDTNEKSSSYDISLLH